MTQSRIDHVPILKTLEELDEFVRSPDSTGFIEQALFDVRRPPNVDVVNANARDGLIYIRTWSVERWQYEAQIRPWMPPVGRGLV